jgi:preprotein translocase subunit SecD
MKITDIKGIMKIIVALLFFIILSSCAQNRQEKTIAIINKLKLVETQQTNFKFQLEPLKYQVTGNDSMRIIEIEKRLTEKEITKRLINAFNEEFSDKEINDIYKFIQTSAFEKIFNSGEIYKIISAQFIDVDKEIKRITEQYSEKVENPANKFEPIPIDKENGFYATVDYNYSTADKNIKLEDKPSITSKDILEVKKVFSNYNNRLEISIVFTKNGAKKFYLLTKENIGKPIAIVIGKQIVSMPTVNSEIIGGKASIIGDFTEDEIDEMIKLLKEK